MAILCAVMAATNGFLALVSILFYLDFRSRDRTRIGWENGVTLTLNEHTEQIVALQHTIALSTYALTSGRATADEPAHDARSVLGGEPFIGLSVPFRPSSAQVEEARAIGSRPMSSETPAAMRARIEAAEEERDRKRKLAEAVQEAAARAVAKIDGVDVEEVRATVEIPAAGLAPRAPSETEPGDGDRDSDATQIYSNRDRATIFGLPTLVSVGTVLGWIADLSPEDLARVEILAQEAGITRDEMLGKLFGAGSAVQSANDAREVPTTPPGAPANDGDKVPPSGPRRT